MMSFGLIVLVTFVLVILGVHMWCRFSELQDQAHPRRQVAARRSIRRYRDHGVGLAEKSNIHGSGHWHSVRASAAPR
jgi:hypothetical protein